MIGRETLAKVIAQVDAAGLDEAAVTALRRTWPDIHFTRCSEDDVPARLRPVAEGPGYDIYLVSGANHCIGFTEHLDSATGLVLALRTEEP